MKQLKLYFTYRELLLNLVQRDLRTRYRRSVLGWLWAFVNPAVSTLVYSFVFIIVFKASPSPGTPSGNDVFAFFLLSATLPWNLLSSGTTGSIAALLSSGSLISRVYFPRELIPVATVLAMAISLAIELGALTILLLIAGYNAIPYLPAVALLLILQTVFVSGLALWLSALNLRYRDVQHLVTIVLLVGFYLTPCMYGLDIIPEHREIFGVNVPLRSIMEVNPMSRFVIGYRNCFYDLRYPSALTIAACFLAAIVSFAFGSWFFNRRSGRFAEEL